MSTIGHRSADDSSKPPLTGVLSFDRDGRKETIQRIQQLTGRTLLCYVAGQDEPILPEDIIYTQELLYPLEPGTSIDLLLNSLGGDIETAEKLVQHDSAGDDSSKRRHTARRVPYHRTGQSQERRNTHGFGCKRDCNERHIRVGPN